MIFGNVGGGDCLIVFYRWFEKFVHRLTKRRAFGKRTLNGLGKNISFSKEREPLRIMVYGDSNSFRPGGSKKSWPGILQNRNRPHLKVFNESRDGRTIGHDTGPYNGLSDIQFRLDAYPSLDYIIIMLGTNDLKIEYGPPTPLKIIRDMGNLIDAIESYEKNIKPILLTPPPMGVVTTGQLAGAHSKVKHLAAEYRKLAIKRGIPWVDIYSKLHVSDDLENDRIHINSAGRQKIACAVGSEISAQLTPQWRMRMENKV